MITSLEQCEQIQKRRVAAKKRGYSKAVRTFIQKNYHDSYRSQLNDLPVIWSYPETEEE